MSKRTPIVAQGWHPYVGGKRKLKPTSVNRAQRAAREAGFAAMHNAKFKSARLY